VLYMIYCRDGIGQEQRRLDNHADHRAYLAEAGAGLLVAGPLLSDDGSHMIGSLFLLEAASRQEAERFNAGDPFCVRGIWESVTIHRFDKRTDRRGTEGAP
jgi:uncharacterized protein YciI